MLFGSTIVAPEGETWTGVGEGCEPRQETETGGSVVSCLSTTERFATG